MEYYVEQLKGIVSLIEALNTWDSNPENSDLMLKQPIVLVHPMEPDTPLGELVDEIGGAWSFKPAES
jgi:hypothetical protein